MSKQAAINEAKQHVGGPLPVRVVCPVCNGGSHHEETFVVWEAKDTGNILATCHRARCDLGTVLVSGSVLMQGRNALQQQDRGALATAAVPPMHPLGQPDVDYLRNKGVEETFIKHMARAQRYVGSIRYDDGTAKGLAMPMFDLLNDERGYIFRPYNTALPKSLTYKDEGYHGMSWYVARDGARMGVVYVVEDSLSALRLMFEGLDAVSMNGTLLNRERVDAIRSAYRQAHLCFDADATGKAVKYALEFGARLSLKVVRLEQDIKNMNPADMKDFIREQVL